MKKRWLIGGVGLKIEMLLRRFIWNGIIVIIVLDTVGTTSSISLKSETPTTNTTWHQLDQSSLVQPQLRWLVTEFSPLLTCCWTSQGVSPSWCGSDGQWRRPGRDTHRTTGALTEALKCISESFPRQQRATTRCNWGSGRGPCLMQRWSLAKLWTMFLFQTRALSCSVFWF